MTNMEMKRGLLHEEFKRYEKEINEKEKRRPRRVALRIVFNTFIGILILIIACLMYLLYLRDGAMFFTW